ncbi:cell division protein FtsH [Petrotoga mexicana DSM 14811]|uniref:ATP-dependent zinc metalloprotease FtsH n=1 Tax=Petrotoga mexicana DSM 14811 TaxID=1122954 RepID=A0A2K1P7V6_9BACT|nr:ATP-dependent zinc metalloprotease FtsH [Petrotoga mexicana]PNR98870.1 cell division protein FtsH [Petrotoga mexicana DSM 14811]
MPENKNDKENRNDKENKNTKEEKKKVRPSNIIWVYIIFAVIFIGALISLNWENNPMISYSEMLSLINNGQVESIKINQNGNVEILGKDGTTYESFSPALVNDKQYVNSLIQKGIKIEYVESIGSKWWFALLINIIPIVIMVLFFFWLYRSATSGAKSSMNFGKSKAKKYEPIGEKVTFKDVAGIDEVLEEVEDIVKFLKNPQEFQELGARMPKGTLLVGPPGTGKTLTARAIAGEADVPFYYASGSDFVELFVGVGASRVRDLFKTAKENAPAIIFIDELDAVGRQRGAGLGGGNDEREQTLNALLVELDGFDPSTGVIVMAATNRPDVLDKALLRPGRFDKKIMVPPPDVKGREEILKIHIRKKKIAPDVDLKLLAKRTPGFVGADLENLVNEAALIASRKKKTQIEMSDFEEAIDRVLTGPSKKYRIISDKEKKILSYHELGHAILAYLLPNTDPVYKITIIPRGAGSLGSTLQIPEKDKYLIKKSEILDRIVVALGGRASEKLVFNFATTGAKDDLRKATDYAKSMIYRLGMSKKLGPVYWEGEEEEIFLGSELTKQKNYSEETAKELDVEVKKIINSMYDKAVELLKQNKERLDLLASYIFKKETIYGEEFKKLMNKDLEELKEYIGGEKEINEFLKIDVVNHVNYQPV